MPNAEDRELRSAGRGVTVRVQRAFDAPAEALFAAWLDPALIGRWMFGPDVRDEEIVHLRTDPKVGGRFSFLVRRDGQLIDHVGTYRAIERPRLLAFSWGIAGESVDESEVRVEIAARDRGCELTLTHEIPEKWVDYAKRTEVGWTKMLDALGAALG
jgi:uncharacterized protein YndB with AHSA1/START domain